MSKSLRLGMPTSWFMTRGPAKHLCMVGMGASTPKLPLNKASQKERLEGMTELG